MEYEALGWIGVTGGLINDEIEALVDKSDYNVIHFGSAVKGKKSLGIAMQWAIISVDSSVTEHDAKSLVLPTENEILRFRQFLNDIGWQGHKDPRFYVAVYEY